jgi:predicted nucleic acid-binding protein
MNYLFDADALLALGYAGHSKHQKVLSFYAAHRSADLFYTTPITELAFVRIGTVAGYFTDLSHAQIALALMVSSSRGRIAFLADDLGASTLPAYVKRPKDTTDGHLLALALAHGAKLLTLDTGIPDAELIA